MLGNRRTGCIDKRMHTFIPPTTKLSWYLLANSYLQLLISSTIVFSISLTYITQLIWWCWKTSSRKVFNTGENDPRECRNITKLHTAEDLSKIILRNPQQSKIIRTNTPRTIRSGFIKSCNFSRNAELNTTRKYQFSTWAFETVNFRIRF